MCCEKMYDSDDYDFTPSNSSKLASLFDTSGISHEDSNNSLTYTAPKQPKSSSTSNNTLKEEENKGKVQTTAVVAKIVSLWKLENNEYKCLGKHGLAIIGSTDLGLYELIAYKEKTNIIIRTKLCETFCYYNQQNNFSSFYDSSSQNWLVKFDNNDQKQFSDTLSQYGAKVIEKTIETAKSEVDSKIIKPDLLPKPEIYSSESKTKEDQQSDNSESVKRASILHRIAKMGQQVISKPLSQSSELSDSEQEEPEIDKKTPPLRRHKKVAHSALSPVHVSRQVVVEPQYMPTQNYYPNSPNESFNQFLIAQNTELKIHLANISTKLDNLSIGQNQSQNKNNDESAMKSRIKTLELMNENLQTALERSEKKFEVLQRSSQENSKSTETVLELEENIKRLTLEMENVKKHESTLTEALQNQIKAQENVISNQKTRIKELEDQFENCQQKQNSNDELEATISSLKKELELLKQQTDQNSFKSRINVDKVEDMVKQHMSNMFQTIISNFQEGVQYSSSDIQSKIAKELRKATFKIIDDYKHIADSGEG
nr:unnamed protein product [Callosobruchus chinensis]